MSTQPVRIGVVGAGANTRSMHIPGFQRLDGVEVVSVANRSRESGARAAAEFGIPVVYDRWEELVAADDCDAICIGTWPYMHAPVTLAALDAGKHVLCEARMAMNAAEAHRMLAAAKQHPGLVAQVVPAPFSFGVDATVADLIRDGYLGDLLAADVRATGDGFIDPAAPMTWRQDLEWSGLNIMAMGIWYETLMRWVGPAVRVCAMTKINVPERVDASGQRREIGVPDHVDVLAELACGANAALRVSTVTGLAAANMIALYGSEGTLVYEAPSSLRGGRRGDAGLQELVIPEDKRGGWRVEEEFVNAIRGEETVRFTTFEDGVRYMEFTEAVTRSAATGIAMDLPLANE
ncbi:MAG: Gfo/Idh/MocA family oxidoreductase [Verrucomicrobia bacterium]|nr:Gfo/Idh/MocA family oxidoreductase [Verrucomicrobiota bacterium]MDA1085457.1 Gfo/Idh/MocA family oxidoreductase [Verrucomicrobiota bacterium]